MMSEKEPAGLLQRLALLQRFRSWSTSSRSRNSEKDSRRNQIQQYSAENKARSLTTRRAGFLSLASASVVYLMPLKSCRSSRKIPRLQILDCWKPVQRDGLFVRHPFEALPLVVGDRHD